MPTTPKIIVQALSWLSNSHLHAVDVGDAIPVDSQPVVALAKPSVQIWPLTRVVPPAAFTDVSTVTGDVVIIVDVRRGELHQVGTLQTPGSERII